MSLWKVDDQATQELMSSFYQRINKQTTNLREAFRSAQISLQKKYTHPYYWGAFVFSGK
jgi:CHAT domain-containing protein